MVCHWNHNLWLSTMVKVLVGRVARGLSRASSHLYQCSVARRVRKKDMVHIPYRSERNQNDLGMAGFLEALAIVVELIMNRSRAA